MAKFVSATRTLTKSFKTNLENRSINQAHVNRLKREMIKSLEVMPPITVNLITRNVIDGQHRLLAFQKLVDEGLLSDTSKIKVMYVDIDKDQEKEAIVNANTNSKNWTLNDYVKSHSVNNDNFQILDEWCSNHELTHDGNKKKYRYACAMMLGVGSSPALKDGTLKLTDEDLALGTVVHDEILEIVRVLNKPLKGNFYETMVVSWFKRRNLHDFPTWIREFKAKKTPLSKMPFHNKGDWERIFALVQSSIELKKIS